MSKTKFLIHAKFNFCLQQNLVESKILQFGKLFNTTQSRLENNFEIGDFQKEKKSGKGENAGNKNFLLFPKYFVNTLHPHTKRFNFETHSFCHLQVLSFRPVLVV